LDLSDFEESSKYLYPMAGLLKTEDYFLTELDLGRSVVFT